MADFQIGPFNENGIITTGDNGLQVGVFSSTTAGPGVGLGSATKAVDVCADDAGVALVAGSYRAIRSRMLITKAITTHATVDGLLGQVKIGKAITTGGDHIAGVDGYLEVLTGATIGGDELLACGVRGRVDCPSGAVVASGGYLSAFGCGADDIDCTHTGKVVALNVLTPTAGTFDALARVTAAGGCYQASIGAFATKGVFVYVDDTKYCIPLYATS